MTDRKDKQGKPTIETSDVTQRQHFAFWHTISFHPFLKSTIQAHQWHARIHTGIANVFSLCERVYAASSVRSLPHLRPRVNIFRFLHRTRA
jgi:hypothetical protein